MAQQIAVDPAAEFENAADDGTNELAPDVACQRLAIVNIAYYGQPHSREWVLIDAGIKGKASRIRKTAEERFGENAKPAAIILTHGHFDHVGTLKDLLEEWDVPIYAHELELPYLDGRSCYPPPDPSVGGGMMARTAGLLPRAPIDVSRWLQVLPEDGSVPYMPGWKCVQTPGHSPGHISLWRETDRLLIAGDAFITTAQESAFAVMTQRPEIHGPPMYYTQDWENARESVRRLAALQPETVITGHGPAMHGREMQRALDELAREFDQIAVPEHGRYVHEPVVADETGTRYVPAKS